MRRPALLSSSPQEKAEEMAKEQGFKLGVSKTSFKGNSKVMGGLGLWVAGRRMQVAHQLGAD